MREALIHLTAAVDDCASEAVWARNDQELVHALTTTHAACQRLTGMLARLVRELDGRGVPATEHAANTRVWLRDRLRISVHAATQLVELGQHLDHRPALDTAVTGGTLGVEQAQVIAATLDALPEQVGAATVEQAETALVEMAAQFEPRALRLLGRRILSHVDPDAGQAAEAQALRREQARAHQQRTLALTPAGAGRTRITGWLDNEAAAVVNAALDPLCTPSPDDSRTCGQRRADALVEACRLASHTETLPDNGGDRPHIVVTVPYDILRAALGTAQLDTGEQLTPEQARRLACDAQLIPAVLGSDGQVLDVGRARRLFTGPMRRALILRDGGCAFPACDRRATWCDAHHITSWLDGGTTSVDNGVLLCGFHHRLIHTTDWTVRLGPDQLPEFVPPAHTDPTRTPQRNIYHRPDRRWRQQRQSGRQPTGAQPPGRPPLRRKPPKRHTTVASPANQQARYHHRT